MYSSLTAYFSAVRSISPTSISLPSRHHGGERVRANVALFEVTLRNSTAARSRDSMSSPSGCSLVCEEVRSFVHVVPGISLPVVTAVWIAVLRCIVSVGFLPSFLSVCTVRLHAVEALHFLSEGVNHSSFDRKLFFSSQVVTISGGAHDVSALYMASTTVRKHHPVQKA